MGSREMSIGKIFVSYTHADRPFVRRLARNLKQHGYHLWLDEKELVAGDPLSQRISEALVVSKVVLVVVSSASARSKWLKYELNHATERMIKGECRVIPLVVETTRLPSEVTGIRYADFTKSFKHGINSVLTALSHEVAIHRSDFWQAMGDSIGEVFGSVGYVSAMSEYSSDDYETISMAIPLDSGRIKVSVTYDVVSDYMGSRKPLGEAFWGEYSEVNANRPESQCLLVSERPIGFPMDSFFENNPRVGIRSFHRHTFLQGDSLLNDKTFVVIVDMSGVQGTEEQHYLLMQAKECLRQLLEPTLHGSIPMIPEGSERGRKARVKTQHAVMG